MTSDLVVAKEMFQKGRNRQWIVFSDLIEKELALYY